MEKVIILAIILVLATYILNKREINREKLSIYECGFQAFEDSRNTFYVKYFIIAIIFLIFDLETMLIYPFSYVLEDFTIKGYIVFFIFLVLLVWGLIIELYRGIL